MTAPSLSKATLTYSGIGGIALWIKPSTSKVLEPGSAFVLPTSLLMLIGPFERAAAV